MLKLSAFISGLLFGLGLLLAGMANPAKVQAFLDDASQHHSWMFTIPNWKFGLGFCGPFTLFSWLYIIGSTLAILRFFTRKLRGPRLRASA